MPEAAPAPADVSVAPAKSKLLLIVLCSLVAAGAAGGAVYFMVGGKKDDAQAQADEKESKTSKSGKQDPKAPAVYIKFDPPFVVNFENKGMMRFLQISAEVMTRDPATADLIKEHDPRLRNDLLLLLGSQTYDTISTREGKERLRNEALQTVARIIGEEGGKSEKVEQLYFTSFVMQ